MGKDYVTLDDADKNNDIDLNENYSLSQVDDFPSMFMRLISSINFKIAFFLFVLGIFLFSDVFMRNILGRLNGTINQLGYPTSHGTILQLIFLVIGYLIIDLLVQGKYL